MAQKKLQKWYLFYYCYFVVRKFTLFDVMKLNISSCFHVIASKPNYYYIQNIHPSFPEQQIPVSIPKKIPCASRFVQQALVLSFYGFFNSSLYCCDAAGGTACQVKKCHRPFYLEVGARRRPLWPSSVCLSKQKKGEKQKRPKQRKMLIATLLFCMCARAERGL